MVVNPSMSPTNRPESHTGQPEAWSHEQNDAVHGEDGHQKVNWANHVIIIFGQSHMVIHGNLLLKIFSYDV